MLPYGIVLAPDMLSAIFTTMASTVVAGGALYILGCHDKCVNYPAFMPLYLCMATGLHGAFYTGDIFTLFVFQELMIMSSVVLVAISDNRLGVEAAIKYLLISAMGSPDSRMIMNTTVTTPQTTIRVRRSLRMMKRVINCPPPSRGTAPLAGTNVGLRMICVGTACLKQPSPSSCGRRRESRGLEG